MRSVPALKFVSNYHDDPAYVEALAASVHEHRREFGITRHLLMSFHGVPERYVALGDPYRDQCQRTATLLAQRLGLAADAWSVSFQSRFGRARWLQPYTSEVLAGIPKRGVKSVSVICPGFAADCLETLEEIGMENRDVFMAAGGEQYHYIPALNARADHVASLSALVIARAASNRPAREAPKDAPACLWLKAFHIIGVVSWFAALLYLPRLFVYHSQIQGARFRIRPSTMTQAMRASRSWSASCS